MSIVLAALVAVIVRAGGPLPPRYTGPAIARHLAAAALDDYSWRGARFALWLGEREMRYARDEFTYARLAQPVGLRPADPSRVWAQPVRRALEAVAA